VLKITLKAAVDAIVTSLVGAVARLPKRRHKRSGDTATTEIRVVEQSKRREFCMKTSDERVAESAIRSLPPAVEEMPGGYRYSEPGLWLPNQ
jgi:hypothetical protein